MTEQAARDKEPTRSDVFAREPKGAPPGSIPLSYAQERLWFLDQLEPGNTAFNLPRAVRLRGHVDREALAWALNEIVRRHEILRTCYTVNDGTPAQTVLPHEPTPLPLIRIGGSSAQERDELAGQWIAAEARKPLDLVHAAPARPVLLALGEEEHILLFLTHHIAFDGWSEGVLLRELSELYPARVAGHPSPLTEPELQYAEFALWQRSHLREQELEPQLSYWKRVLADLPPRLALPSDPRLLPVVGRGAGRESIAIDAKLLNDLRHVVRQENATPFMGLFAAFIVLLHRYSAQTDFVIGFPSAGRVRRELEASIGCFVEALPLRADLSGHPTYREVVRRVRRQILEGLTHNDVPFERIVAELRPERSLTHAPLFDVLFNSHTFRSPVQRIGDIAVSPFQPPDGAPRYALTLYVDMSGDSLRLEAVFDRSSVSPELARAMLSQYSFLVHQVVSEPERDIGTYSLVSPETASRLPDPTMALAEPRFPAVTDQIRVWSERSPSAPAVSRGGRNWSYADLSNAVEGLVASLAMRGLRPGEVVAVTGQRSFGLIVSLIAAMQVGAVILPLDPIVPPRRLGWMSAAASAKLTLCADDAGSLRIAEWLTAPCLMVGEDDGRLRGQEPFADRAVRIDLDPDSPAYIFFTSGTTGTPKGVLGNHKGLAHFLAWQRETFQVGPQDRCAQLTSLSFDVMLRDIFLPLTSGAALCLLPRPIALGSPSILEWLDIEGVTLVHLVPTVAQSWLLDVPDAVTLRTLRYAFFAGEALPADFVRTWRSAFPSSGEIVNLYGPTETTMAKSFYVVPLEPGAGVVPVGWPLPETQTLVLDPEQQLCGIAETGEIVIRTPFRTLGYLKPGEGTSAFRRNPHTDDPRDTLYWTGDRGRYLPDGTLQFLGREDEQVKIHGVRIEPAEVASEICAHPWVKTCVVVSRLGTHNQPELIAYLVSKERPPTSSELRVHLATRLPAAMIPAHFVALEELPLSANGKLDRRRLPPAAEDSMREATGVPVTRGRLERRIAAIWEEVLGVKPIGSNDNFFDLGGHSLMAVRLLSRIERATGRKLPVRALFEAPTVNGLAAIIRSSEWQPASRTSLVPLQAEGSRDPVFWVHAAGGHVVSFKKLARYLGNDQPSYALEGAEFGEAGGNDRVETIAARYLDDILRMRPTGPFLLGGLSFGGLVAVEMARQLRAAGHAVPFLGLLDTHGPGYGRWTLWRDWRFWLRQRLEFHQGNLSVLKGMAKVRYVGSRLERLVIREAQPARLAMRRLLSWLRWGTRADIGRAYRAAQSARHAYHPAPYDGPITLFRARTQPRGITDRYLGWGELAKGGLQIVDVDGAHVSIMAESRLPALGEAVRRILETTGGSS